jgi:hypothetical protein
MNEDERNAINAGIVYLPDRRGMFYGSRLQHEQEKQIIGEGPIEHVPETGKNRGNNKPPSSQRRCGAFLDIDIYACVRSIEV